MLCDSGFVCHFYDRHSSFIRNSLTISLAAFAFLMCLVWLIAPSFNGCPPGGIWCTVMYVFTLSAGTEGTTVILLLISIALAFLQDSPRGRVLSFIKLFVLVGVVLAGFARMNEYLIKPVFAVWRPSHQYIIEHTREQAELDSVYKLPLSVRQAYFTRLVREDPSQFREMSPLILSHWLDEAGYSLPSGHSFNAFLLAGFLTFLIVDLNGQRRSVWSVLPMSWAVIVGLSRVELGVHTPLDVTVGSGLGLLVSYGLLSIPWFNRLVVPRKVDMTEGRKSRNSQ